MSSNDKSCLQLSFNSDDIIHLSTGLNCLVYSRNVPSVT